MCDEKDMIEINLNESSNVKSKYHAAKSNYFGNIRFNSATTTAPNDFACAQYRNMEEEKRAEEGHRVEAISCLRQMYCPECEQRLDAASSVRYEKLFLCCLPFVPLNRIVRRTAALNNGVKWHAQTPRRLQCNKCGSSLGQWEKCN